MLWTKQKYFLRKYNLYLVWKLFNVLCYVLKSWLSFVEKACKSIIGFVLKSLQNQSLCSSTKYPRISWEIGWGFFLLNPHPPFAAAACKIVSIIQVLYNVKLISPFPRLPICCHDIYLGCGSGSPRRYEKKPSNLLKKKLDNGSQVITDVYTGDQKFSDRSIHFFASIFIFKLIGVFFFLFTNTFTTLFI